MKLHAPSTGWFVASLIVAVIAAVSVLTPIPYISSYGAWTAIFAYILLAVSNLT